MAVITHPIHVLQKELKIYHRGSFLDFFTNFYQKHSYIVFRKFITFQAN